MRRTSTAVSVRAALGVPHVDDDLGLTFYGKPPDVEVSVREFEEAARDRLRVLHVFDRLCAYDGAQSGPAEQRSAMAELKPKVRKELLESHLSLEYPSGMDNVETFLARKADFVRRDAVSHFALRLAFCKTRDSRDWFLRQEQRLFTVRFERLNPEAQEAFVMRSGLKCKPFRVEGDSHEAKTQFHDLQHVTPAAKIWHGDGKPDWDSKFYVMPFTEVDPSLISNRRVVVRGGLAHVPSSALKQILGKRFKEALAASLDVAFQGLPVALGDPRIGGFLKDLQEYGMQLLVAPKAAAAEDAGEKLTLENFEALMVRSFPPCMRRLVEQQRELKKHLKHAGRLQLRPFLKDCGFAIDDSHRWWKQELGHDPTVDAVSYDKNYAYDVEHAYGKKGHLQGQNCFGCPKIIGFPAEASGQVHGCLFKSLEGPALRQQMHRWKVPEQAMLEMEKLLNGKHFQLACIEYFRAMHPGHTGDGVGNSPGDFFRESCRVYTKKHEAEGEQKTSSPPKPLAAPEGGPVPVLMAAGA